MKKLAKFDGGKGILSLNIYRIECYMDTKRLYEILEKKFDTI